MSHYDDPPPDVIDDLGALRDADAFRFANRLRAWAEFDGDRVVSYDQDGGVTMGSTTVRLGPLGATFAAVAMPVISGEPEIGDGWIRFTQTAGGRTAAPLPRRVPRPPFVRLQAPLVWTTLTVTLHSDGHSVLNLAGASPFPRHWVYGAGNQLLLKAGSRIEENGLSVAYLPDHAPQLGSAAAEALAADVDLLLHDGQFLPSEQPVADAYGHATVRDAADFAARCGARRLVLIHHSPGRTDDEMDALAKECGIEVAVQGQLLTVDRSAPTHAPLWEEQRW